MGGLDRTGRPEDRKAQAVTPPSTGSHCTQHVHTGTDSEHPWTIHRYLLGGSSELRELNWLSSATSGVSAKKEKNSYCLMPAKNG